MQNATVGLEPFNEWDGVHEQFALEQLHDTITDPDADVWAGEHEQFALEQLHDTITDPEADVWTGEHEQFALEQLHAEGPARPIFEIALIHSRELGRLVWAIKAI